MSFITPEQFVKKIWMQEPKDEFITKQDVFLCMKEYGEYIKKAVVKEFKDMKPKYYDQCSAGYQSGYMKKTEQIKNRCNELIEEK